MRNIQIALVLTNSLLIIVLCIGIVYVFSEPKMNCSQQIDNDTCATPQIEATIDALATSAELRVGSDLTEEQIKTAVSATLESMGVGAPPPSP